MLPQTVRHGEQAWHDPEVREEWVHCLGNLDLLSRPKNTEAGNADFSEKKERYFQTKDGVTPFTLNKEVLEYE